MKSFIKDLAPAVKKETKKVTLITIIGVVLMILVFGIFHVMDPTHIPFNYTIVLGGIVGGTISVLNFFLMGIAVQKVVNANDDDSAKLIMKSSYKYRLLMQIFWIIVSILSPMFNAVAGIIPLLFPSLGIKFMAIFKK